MEYVNGEFLMKSCDEGDPSAFDSISACESLIKTIGFLPLFSNTITGFSVEEHVPRNVWFTGDSSTDPWEWRQILSSDPEIAYGKFFNKTAGFISKDFFPVFANYRRNGYDFDALFEDELVSYRSKKVMDVFELDDEAVGKTILSSEVKQLAGFGKDGGEKNFEGVLTDLQMQTYLIISSFQQKKNKKGQSYGWYLAVLETPETKWGRDFVTSHYSDDPSQSWSEIKTRMLQFFPDAAEKDVTKLLGIRYSGVEKKPSAPVKPKQKIIRLIFSGRRTLSLKSV
ncbi:MAG: hypothetical protein IJ899_04755 [Blautia sp.]|nr:hypothetical protein [Blautia sp.]